MVKKFVSLFMAVALIFTSVPAFATAIAEAAELSSLDNAPTISVKNVQVNKGTKTAEVEVWIENNPGISSTKMDIGYDDEMVLTGVRFNSAFGTYVTAPEPYTNPQPLSVISPVTDLNVNGLFATLTFDLSNVSEGKESLDVTVEYEQENTFNASFDDVVFETKNGKITFKEDEIAVEKLEILTSSTENTVVVRSPEKIDDLKLYVAAYQGDTMLGASSQDADVKVGENTFYVTPTWDASKCEYARAFLWGESLTPYAEQTLTTKPSVAIQNVQVDYEKNTATVDVAVLKNPGISSLKMNVGYDSNLKLTKVDYNTEVFGTYITAPEPYTNPQPVSFISPLEDVHADGTLATLTFDISNVPEGCEAANISIDYDQENTFNGNFDEVVFNTVDGKINFDSSMRLMGENDFSLMEAEPLTLTVVGKTAMQGKTVDVDVVISNNPGISALKVNIAYDKVLTLQNVELSSAFPQVATPVPYQNPQSISLMSPLAEVSVNGTLATLTFLVADNVENGYEAKLNVTYDKANILDMDLNEVEMNVVNGSVKVFDFIPGDVNNDGSVNLKDAVLLFRYVGDMGVEVNEKAIDVTGDGVATLKDAVLLFRYASGWKVELIPGTICAHELTEIAPKEATCTEDGNIQYWHCSKCDKYFKDADAKTTIGLADTVIKATGHNIVILPAVAPTYDKVGLTEGRKCSICDYVEVEQETVPVLQKEEYSISYYITNNDKYLETIVIENPNPLKYSTQDGLVLKDLIVDGYNFVGWYTAQVGGTKVTKINSGESGNISLYAQWEKVRYTISFASDMVPIADITYTVGEERSLPKPVLDKYTFVGWSDKEGNMWESIPAGTTGNINLYANWASNRNRAVAVDELENPIIFEDPEEGIILFTYEIGEIRNVPLFTTLKLQCANGIITTVGKTNTTEISEENAETIAETISNATTNSAAWSLSKDWNATTQVSQTFIDEKGYTREEAETVATNSSNTYTVGKSSGGSSFVENSSSESFNRSNNQAHSSENINEYGQTVNLQTNSDLGINVGAKGTVGIVELSGQVGLNLSTENSLEKYNHTKNIGTANWSESINEHISSSSVSGSTKNWNTSSGFSNSNSISTSHTISEKISRVLTEEYGYGESYSEGGSNSASQAVASTDKKSDEFSATLTYHTSEIEAITTEFTSTGHTKGGYRMVMAGTVHVFAVVGYNVAENSYFVYTYNILDDETEEYLDYSYDETFNDYETSIIPFEIPYFVNRYVDNKIAKTEGLVFEADTGMIVGYEPVNGVSDKVIVIPSYMSVDNNDGTYSAIAVRGIAPGLFKNNTDIVAVQIGNYVEEIPESAFEGCTSLEYVLSPSVTKIGDNAFKDCESLKSFNLPERITELGTDAFKGVPEINVVAANADVAETAAAMGAKRITLDISMLSEDNMDNLTFETGEIDYFELQGKDKEYENLRLDSDAENVVINGVTITGKACGPIELSAEKVTLDRVNMDCPGFALILKADETDIILNRNIYLNSANGHPMLSKSVKFSRLSNSISAKLNITGDMLVCGQVSEDQYLLFTNGQIVYLTEEEYDAYLNCRSLAFDANGGSVDQLAKTISYNEAIGELPIPVREGYTFEGWYSEIDGGVKITENTIVTTTKNMLVYAHWTPAVYSVTWDDAVGYVVEVERTASPNMNATLSVLANGAEVYHGDVLSVKYTANEGFNIETTGEKSITVTGNITNEQIFANASAKSYTATWSAVANCTISVTRISSPYAKASIGAIGSGETIYYGDVLTVTYTPAAHYELALKGYTSITVNGNVDKSMIYASVKSTEKYIATFYGTGYLKAKIDIYFTADKHLHLKGWIYDERDLGFQCPIYHSYMEVAYANGYNPDCPGGAYHGIDHIYTSITHTKEDRVMIDTNPYNSVVEDISLWDHWIDENGSITH